jgi:hypothetical protein
MPQNRFRPVSRLAVTAGLAALVAIAPGLSSPTWASTSAAQHHDHSVAAPKHESLSGKWSGKYGGSFSGTFVVSWQQSGHSLSGTIKISGFENEATNIHGTVQGTSIRFGTVGSEAITYLGSVSGKSMSGTWKIQAGGRSLGGGSWTASKSS